MYIDHSYDRKLYILKCRFVFEVSNSSRETCQLSSTRWSLLMSANSRQLFSQRSTSMSVPQQSMGSDKDTKSVGLGPDY